MRIARSLVAVLAGFGFLLFAGFVAGGLSTLVAKLLVGTLSALMAGWMTARMAAYSPFGHAFVLALFVGAANFSLIRGVSPAGWYPLASAISGVAGVLAGGWIRAAADHARGTV
jgi:hypothetical protein